MAMLKLKEYDTCDEDFCHEKLYQRSKKIIFGIHRIGSVKSISKSLDMAPYLIKIPTN